MEPIFSFSNPLLPMQPVCWLEGDTAFSRNGLPAAFVNKGAVYASKTCRYLGQFDHGVFRDHLGCIVAFPRNVWWSRIPRPCQGEWTPHIHLVAPPCRVSRESLPARIEEHLLRRSTLNWDSYILGCEAKQEWATRR
ncbi:MAG: 4-fold beta flower protein [Janthinobacterium lividum]